MQSLETSDYRGYLWPSANEEEDDSYPLYVVHLFSPLRSLISVSPLVMKVRSRASSILSGASTPGGGAFRSLSEGDLEKADAALSQVNGVNGR
jgi:glycogen(starch) synthase